MTYLATKCDFVFIAMQSRSTKIAQPYRIDKSKIRLLKEQISLIVTFANESKTRPQWPQ